MTVDTVVHRFLGHRFTAAVVHVSEGGRVVFERAYGAVDDRADAVRALVTTRFDLASLTKVFVSSAALRLVAAGLLTLDDPLTHVLAEWVGTPHARITLRMLLAHTAGLQSGADFRTLTRESVENYALMRPLIAAPGSAVVYSDLGFIVLGVVLARVAGVSLTAVVANLAQALGTTSLAFVPRLRERAAIPATEYDAWRGRVRGTVHDEKAALMNGVAGHAGLFGTARDVALLAQLSLDAKRGCPNGVLPPELALDALRQHGAHPVLRRGLGWALKTRDDNSCGVHMSPATFGHTGFTGTCVWADPERDRTIVFLTNAVYFGRTDLRAVRAAVCDAVFAQREPCARSA